MDRAWLCRNGVAAIKTDKTGEIVTFPLLPPLLSSIEHTQTGDSTFLITSKGTPFKKESFGNWFRKACHAANVPGAAHGLRKAGAVRAAENGATEAQLNALFGWADGSRESATYTRKAGGQACECCCDAAHSSRTPRKGAGR